MKLSVSPPPFTGAPVVVLIAGLGGSGIDRPAARKMRFALMGPAFIAAIGYIDPGNFATNIQAGASFGYKLLWVVVWANLMAMLIQVLSAKLGIATGKNLAEQIRDHYPRPLVWFYWVQAEIIAMATDLAEFIGAAIGFKLILGVSLQSRKAPRRRSRRASSG
jgi:manganese transport protein